MTEKLIFAKLLGEMYRIQKSQGIYNGTDGRIFGLLNGVEEDVESEISNLGFISREDIAKFCDVFDPYYKGEKSLDEIPSSKEIQLSLENEGISESKFITILEYLYLNGSYTLEIEKIKSGIKRSGSNI
ncbi:hypothetical protein [Paenibacillus durus]|uniref:Uncharacterized protein n=1 Tax=Paenibacillus durus ATCC 35681 TaxID=1333534 RepID=A0A0F7F8P1_PAEDU|nr:hypothetical protein [Paenibacillus durus]AKG34669.1 hypothetical protein VK70_08835 [Paenibacillus durus ATCC 35681]